LRERSRLERGIGSYRTIERELEDTLGLIELAEAEGDQAILTEAEGTLKRLREEAGKRELESLLSGEADASDTYLEVHAGAGGTEAQDWAEMLLRMYTRWAERRGYKVEIIDLLEAEGGIKSVTAEVTGEFAYGLLKAESGIHRLVRISPFDASARRHTSFASVFASPVIDDTIEVDIRPEDIRIDTYRAGGAGGQHVNKTDSAVRITHFPTGIVVQCQNERSQHKNKALAMKVLRSRLYQYYRERQEEERAKQEKEKKDISWGNQIRSYVFQPYTMVKDHRTKQESGNIQAVMDGALDPFIESYLAKEYEGKRLWA
jgi:peptide chain release factor 2